MQSVERRVDLAAVLESTVTIGVTDGAGIGAPPQPAYRATREAAEARADVPARTAIPNVGLQIDAGVIATCRAGVAKAFAVRADLLVLARGAATSAIPRIVIRGDLAAVAAEILVAVASPGSAGRLALRLDTRNDGSVGNDAFAATPADVLRRRSTARVTAGAAVLVVIAKVDALAVAVRLPRRTATCSLPADFACRTSISTCAAIPRIGIERDFTTVVDEFVAIRRILTTQHLASPGRANEERVQIAGLGRTLLVARAAMIHVIVEIRRAQARFVETGSKGSRAVEGRTHRYGDPRLSFHSRIEVGEGRRRRRTVDARAQLLRTRGQDDDRNGGRAEDRSEGVFVSHGAAQSRRWR